ncbi:MAG: putative CRISPR-associated protein [Verrucomicrobiales bacterium]|nr:putative CRISPR-associated protein [Verrucomicrobiales bacterium]
MNQLHLVTVGISLLTNYARANNLALENVLRRHKQLAEFLKTDPRAACSEINSLDSRTGLLRKKNKGLAVTLVYSATAGQESRLAARLIGNFLKLRGVEVTEIKLKDIGVPANPQAEPAEAARLAEAGLSRLYDTLEKHLKKLKQQHPTLEIAFNATGGFKAETAILYGLGCDLGIPVYYLHETYKVPIVLPVCAVPF